MKKDKNFINLGGIKGWYIYILAKISDLEKYNKNDTVFIKPEHASEYAVLAFAILDTINRKQDKKWCKEDVKGLQKCKPEIIAEGQHFDSSGIYLHFGNLGYYGKNS